MLIALLFSYKNTLKTNDHMTKNIKYKQILQTEKDLEIKTNKGENTHLKGTITQMAFWKLLQK